MFAVFVSCPALFFSHSLYCVDNVKKYLEIKSLKKNQMEVLASNAYWGINAFLKIIILQRIIEYTRATEQYGDVEPSCAAHLVAIRDVPIQLFHFGYDTDIVALSIGRYRYQYDTLSARIIHTFIPYFVVWNVRKGLIK